MRDRIVSAHWLDVRFGQPDIVLVQVVRRAVGLHLAPGLVHPYGLQQVRQAVAVRSEEQQHVLVLAGAAAALSNELQCGLLARRLGIAGVGIAGAENHQCCGLLVVDVAGPLREPMHAGEVALVTLAAHPGGEVFEDLVVRVVVRVAAGQLTDGALGGIPVAGPFVVEEGGLLVEAAQRVAEHRGGVVRERGAEADPDGLDPA